MNYPKVAIMILNWNGLSDTIECLRSVENISYSNFEVLVIDNGSSDKSPEKIRELFPYIKIIENDKNLGYAEGNNVGIRYAMAHGAQYMLVINNDTVVDSQILHKFIAAAAEYPDAGIFGGKVYYYSRPNVINFAGGEWSDEAGDVINIGINQFDDGTMHTNCVETRRVSGCAMFFTAKVAKDVGYLDKRYFLLFEETDWCYRARKYGYKVMFVPHAKVWHKESVSFGGSASESYIYYYTRNRLLWANTHLPITRRWFVYRSIAKELFPRSFEAAGALLLKRIYWDLLKIAQNYNGKHYKPRLLGIRDYAIKRFGGLANRCFVSNDIISESIKLAGKLSVGVIICTKDRFEETLRCISAVLAQSYMPKEIIVVDSSLNQSLKSKLDEYGTVMPNVSFKYIHTSPGIVQQTSIGIKASESEILLFLDDDIIIEPEYISEIIAVFRKYPYDKIGGVTGNMTNIERENIFKRSGLLKYLFCLEYCHNGKFRLSGFPTFPYGLKSVKTVEFLCRGQTAYRREIFDEFSYDNSYFTGYSLGEDVDFSYRVSRKYTNYYTQRARCNHYESKKNRLESREIKKMYIDNFTYFYHKNIPKTLLHKSAFKLAMWGIKNDVERLGFGELLGLFAEKSLGIQNTEMVRSYYKNVKKFLKLESERVGKDDIT